MVLKRLNPHTRADFLSHIHTKPFDTLSFYISRLQYVRVYKTVYIVRLFKTSIKRLYVYMF